MMNRRTFAVLAAVALLGAAAPPTPPVASGDLYARMQRVNEGLSSYQADVTVAVAMHGPPFISPTLQGKVYFKKPDKNAVVFDTIPLLAQQAKRIVAQMEPPAEWPAIYDITPGSDDGKTASFKLVRKKSGRIDHVDVTVDDKTATITGMTYYYKDGGSVAFTQTYDQISGNYVVKQQNGKVNVPNYSADVNSTFSNYKINVPVDDKVFQG
jgi:hypothetical protein